MSPNKNIAAVDIGSYTTRLLIAGYREDHGIIKPLKRNRVYTRLAEGFETGGQTLASAAMDRVIQALREFNLLIKGYSVTDIWAVCTGVIRQAKNQDTFINRIEKETGLRVEIISGEIEARLTVKGVLSAWPMQDRPYLIFDLGGGSTEFIFHNGTQSRILSIPLGTAVWSAKYFTTDPPVQAEILNLQGAIDQVLCQAFPKGFHWEQERLMIGSGGTITTLAAMLHKVPVDEISHEKINGLPLTPQALESLLDALKQLSWKERIRITGLDADRARIIVAGLWIVIGMMRFFRIRQLQASMNDLLEGMMIEHFEGEKS